MGIVNLNRFLIDNVRKSAIHKQKLSQMKNRTISIDTSIYLYKYVSQNALCENFYTMISLFRQNNITPIFVFDGKPPPEKQDVLEERKQEKSRAEEQYKLMEAQWESKQESMTVEEQKEYKGGNGSTEKPMYSNQKPRYCTSEETDETIRCNVLRSRWRSRPSLCGIGH